MHKNLFFKGELPEELRIHGGEPFGGKLPLFIIWYHPDITEEICEAVLDNCDSSSLAAMAISESLSIVAMKNMIKTMVLWVGEKSLQLSIFVVRELLR